MAKPKSPLFSLDAKGTIADALTFQGRDRETLVRKKPVPTDPYSLPQAYQRWLYRDYAYLWTLLTDAEKQVYRTTASRYHLTGFQYWMKGKLAEVANIAGMWHLDEGTGTSAFDSSKNLNHGTVFGTLVATGAISNCRSFDGIDDRIVIPAHASIANIWAGGGTLEILMNATSDGEAGAGVIASKFQLWYIHVNALALGLMYIYFMRAFAGNVGMWRTQFKVCPINQFTQVTLTYDSDSLANHPKIYIDKVLHPVVRTSIPAGARLDDTALDLFIGNYAPLGNTFDGLIDETRLYTRELDITEIGRHSERRYP